MSKDTLDCGCKFDILDFEMVENYESIDHLRNTGAGMIQWQGTIETPYGMFKFTFKKHWTEDNGGENAEITSNQPKDMSDEDWNKLEIEMINYIENEYYENKREWEDMGED